MATDYDVYNVCPTCEGKGTVEHSTYARGEETVKTMTCPKCSGAGEVKAGEMRQQS